MPQHDDNTKLGDIPELQGLLRQQSEAALKAVQERGAMSVVTNESTTNGRQRGRAAPLPSFTFPDSGITVSLRRMAPDTQQHIARAVEEDEAWRAKHPRPEPPLQPVTDLEGKEELVPNVEEPEYQKRLGTYLQAFNIEVGERLIALALRQIVCEVDTESVQTLRDDLAAVGAPLPDEASDEDIYIRRICVSSVFDIQALMAYVQGHSGPTEAAIARHRATFSG